MAHESTLHDRNCFVTLTYREPAPDHINKRDVQLFIKRLRRLVKVRYFATGEYGTRTRRPHYHAVIFGADFLGAAYNINDELYSNPYLDRAWSHGQVSVGRVTLASCMYVAGYVAKKIGDSDTFNLMSRRPGLGHGWLDKYRDEIIRTGVCVIEGKEFPIPKRYLEWYEDDFAEVKKARAQYFRDLTPDQVCKRRSDLAGKQINYESRLSQQSERV